MAVNGRTIDRIIDHWKRTKGQRHQALAFGGAVSIHWGPWTLADRDRVFGPFTGADGKVVMRAAVYVRMLVVKAEDAAGNALFNPEEEIELLAEADPTEVQRIALLMLSSMRQDDAAAAGDDAPKATSSTGERSSANRSSGD